MLRVITRLTGPEGTPWINVTHWKDNDSGIGAQAAADRMDAFWTDVSSIMANDVSWATDPIVTQLTEAGVVTGTFTTTSQTGNGLSAAFQLPQATQALVRLRTGVFTGGREVRGRIFVPGLTTDVLDTNGNLTAGAQDIIQDAADELQLHTLPSLAVWSRKNAAASPVQAVSVPFEYAVLRSRRD